MTQENLPFQKHAHWLFLLFALIGFQGLIDAPVFGQFADVAATVQLDHGGAKDGGVVWFDFNEDGCLDLLINTNTNNNTNRSRLFLSDCNLPNPTFTDVTATYANGIRLNNCERSTSAGDYNNDGYLDFCRNSNTRIEVYINKGPTATPPYSFGDASQNPSFSITTIPGGMNVEGYGWMDYNNDGWLDLVIENHNFGIDIYENPADGTSNFTHETPNGSLNGLPSGGTTGDYMSLCDYDDDGDVDIIARKEDERDIRENLGTGNFTANTSFNEQATNGNKGGVVMCDFDNDGDFDMYWSDNGTNQIFEQTGLNSGTFVATAEPATSSGVAISNTIDGCSCGDVDNDGDMDLFLGGSNAANSYLFTNDGGGTFNFTRNNMGITPGGNTEGTAFGDYDNDGDLDLMVQVTNQPNELWRNSLNDNDYLKVHVLRDVGGSVFREDLGATLILRDCSNNIVGGIRQVSSVTGHGSNDPAIVHFGLPSGPNAVYLLEVRFTTLNGVRPILDTTIVPANHTDQTITMISSDPGIGTLEGCTSALPVVYTNISASQKSGKIVVNWSTSAEIDCDYYKIQKSQDGKDWYTIGEQAGHGTHYGLTNYEFVDREQLGGLLYYRLVQYDFDGMYEYSRTVSVSEKNQDDIGIFPNPSTGKLQVTNKNGLVYTCSIFSPDGQLVLQFIPKAPSSQVSLDLSKLEKGIYFVQLNDREVVRFQLQ